MTPLRTTALVVRFLLELAALVALVYTGVATVEGFAGWLVGLGLAGIGAVAWGMFVAPRAPRPLPTPARLAVEAVVFVAAAVGLVLAEQAILAGILLALYLLDRLALRLSGAPAFESADWPNAGR